MKLYYYRKNDCDYIIAEDNAYHVYSDAIYFPYCVLPEDVDKVLSCIEDISTWKIIDQEDVTNIKEGIFLGECEKKKSFCCR